VVAVSLAILCGAAAVGLTDLPPAITEAGAPSRPQEPPQRGLADIERETILRALAEADGNQSKAARALGITRNQIQYWLRTKGRRA
jgi:transcriptional regulator of acetoin/glycerol metabolism